MTDWINEAASKIIETIAPEQLRCDFDKYEAITGIIEEEHERHVANSLPVDLCVMLDEAQAEITQLKASLAVAAKAIVRSRTGWYNAMELGVLPRRYHDEAEAICAELDTAIASIEQAKKQDET